MGIGGLTEGGMNTVDELSQPVPWPIIGKQRLR
jgi:hypothetical protein